MVTLFFVVSGLLILTELVKGLSANGTPPVLQRFSWQMDLAYFMWTNIVRFRVALVLLLVAVLGFMADTERSGVAVTGAVLAALWLFVYWFFNHCWVGRRKFLPLENPRFTGSSDNQIDHAMQVVGIDHGGEQKAYPVSMLFYHHQIPDSIASLPIWVTYCGLCRSGRVYERSVDGQALDFSLVGAITYNAVFKDKQSGSWWRQETGEAAKGPHQGKVLKDVAMEQMSLENWLSKYPNSQVLQYEPTFQGKYNFITSLLNYEASLPGWHMQRTPPLIIGIELGDEARAYDWNELQERRLVIDRLGQTEVLMLSSEDGSSAFAYDRTVGEQTLEFEVSGDELTDSATQSQWDIFGRCVGGPLKGAQLRQLQNYKQFVRAWASFHPNTTYYKFESNFA